uniref:30S ribosomal protein S18 n=1 Tax=Strongyloides venezuelensis TaxID=75913 RepID=A0A0K0FSZ6_STRVS
MSIEKIRCSISKNGIKITPKRAESKSPSPLINRKSYDNNFSKKYFKTLSTKKQNHESRIDAFLREKQIIDPTRRLMNNLIARNFRVMELRTFIKKESEKNKKNFTGDRKN